MYLYISGTKCVSIASYVIALLTTYCLFQVLYAGIVKMDNLCYCLAESVLSFLQTLQAFKSLIFLCYCLAENVLLKALQVFKSLVFLCYCLAEPERIAFAIDFAGSLNFLS